MSVRYRFFWSTSMFLVLAVAAFSQHVRDIVVVNHSEAEAIFMQRNLRLLAGALEIDEAKAKVMQAKLWPNPTLSIGEVNLWSNHGAEQLGSLLGGWGNYSQVALDVDQLIQTAAKRRKLIALEQTGVRIAEQQFEDLLRSLKVEFRTRLSELARTQQRAVTYRQSHAQLRSLLQGYQGQVQQGNVSQSEYMRLRTSEAELIKRITDIDKENHSAQQALKVLMGVESQFDLVLKGSIPGEVPIATIRSLNAAELLEWVETNNAELQVARLDITRAERQLNYEKAQRVPDLTVQMNYDRGGNIMRDFVGVGLSMDIPFFNRNQGNIRAAQVTVSKNQLLAEHVKSEVGSAAIQAWQALLLSLDQQAQLGEDFEPELDMLHQAYHHNFAQRHISLLEYLDFLNAYLVAKDHILENQHDIDVQLETLRYHVGNQFPD